MATVRQKVMVVDDDRRFRDFACTTIECAGFATSEAADADEALVEAERTPPHLVLLDVRLPRVSGYELYHRLRDRLGDAVPIIFVSGDRTEAYDRVAGLMLGAEDYLVKPFDPDELVARIRRSLRQRAARPAAGEDDDDVIAELTPRERDVLRLVAQGRSTRQIGHDLVVSPRTVGTHIQHILAKLGVENRTQAAAIAYRTGLVTREVEAHSSSRADGRRQATNSRPVPARLAS